MDDEHLDLAYLDDHLESFDLNHWTEHPESIFSITAIQVANDEPDIQVLEFGTDSEIAMYVANHYHSTCLQTIVKNQHVESSVMCPYFRIIMDGFQEDAPTNFKLHNLFQQAGIKSISTRCSKAMIIGLTTLAHMESPISVPHCFISTSIDPDTFLLEVEEIDMVCLKPCAQSLNPEATDLCDIAGMTIPYYVPENVQWLIISYLQHPVALMVEYTMDSICLTWDLFMTRMFMQREPRIPYHLASFYNATTVQRTIESATRPFLAMSAPRPASPVFPEWLTNA
jgi:hypothetical protein